MTAVLEEILQPARELTAFLRDRYAMELRPSRDGEPVSAGLQRAYRTARDLGRRSDGCELWDMWFAQCCAEGRPPDRLRRDSADPVERFWASTVEGSDGHLFWDGPTRNGRPVTRPMSGRTFKPQSAQRFRWILEHGQISAREDVWSTCAETNCLSIEHLAAGWQARGMRMFSDESAIGAVQTCAMQLGRSPLTSEYEKWRAQRRGIISEAALRLRFGSWDKIISTAGLPSPPVVSRVDPIEPVLELVRALAVDLGRNPQRFEWKGSPNARNLIRRVGEGGWDAVLKAADLL